MPVAGPEALGRVDKRGSQTVGFWFKAALWGAVMGRGDLSDAEWELIGTLLPPERGRWARPAGDNRRFLNGMLHVLRVGYPWRDMHERYGK